MVDDYYMLSSYQYHLVPWRIEDGKMYHWYSICSIHQGHDPECNLCQVGSWHEIERVVSAEEREYFEQLKQQESE